MSVTAIGFWLVYIGGIAASVLTPVAGVLLYILVYHLNPQQQWWGDTVRATGLRPAMTVAIAIAIGLAVRRPRFGGIGRQFPAPIVLGLGLAVFALASMTWGCGFSERGAFMAEKIIKVMIFVLVLIRCVRKPHHYHFVIVAWLCGVLYIGYQALGNVGARSGGRLISGLGGPDFAESSGLAVHLVSTLPLIGAMFFMARRWWTRAFILLAGALTVNTIVMTRTRNVIVGLVTMTVVAALSLPRGYRRKGWAAIAVGALLAFQLVDPGWWDRMSTISNYHQDPSAADRLQYWRAAVEMAGDYPVGIGLGNFHEVVKHYVPKLQIRRSAHSTYFACLAELGYPGLVLLMAALTMALWQLGRIRGEAARIEPDLPINVGGWQMRFHLGWHAMALRASLCGYLACSAFTTRLWAEDFWILIGLTACLENVTAHIRHHVQETPQPKAVVGSRGSSKTPPVSAGLIEARSNESHEGREPYANDRDEALVGAGVDRKLPESRTVVIAPKITPTLNPNTQALEPGQSITFEGEYKETPGIPTSSTADPPAIDEGESLTPSAPTSGGDIRWCARGRGRGLFGTASAIEAKLTSTTTGSAQARNAGTLRESTDRDEARVTVDCEGLADLDDEDQVFLDLLLAVGSCLLHDARRSLCERQLDDDADMDLPDLASLLADFDDPDTCEAISKASSTHTSTTSPRC